MSVKTIKARKKVTQEFIPWDENYGEIDFTISDEDKANGSPMLGDVIGVNPNNPKDKWLVSKKYFEENYEENYEDKTLDIKNIEDAKQKINDIEVFGDGDTFRLITKASYSSQGWMKSTKAMDTGNGCVIQVTTQQRNPDGSYAIAEAIAFVPNVRIHGKGENRVIIPIR